MQPITVFSPSQVLHPGESPVDFSPFTHRFLAQGDSWFSFGSVLPWATGNLLNPLRLAASACAVNCARPGKQLVHMVDARRDPALLNLLIGIQAMAWSGILLSGGGNDLIDAIRTPSIDASGRPVPPALRLLLTPAERGTVTAPAGYVSEPGWATFEAHLIAQFHEFVAVRDATASLSAGVPLFVHTYDFITPRDAGAGLRLGPWLFPVLRAYAIPAGDWPALTRHLLQRLSSLMLALNLPNLHVVQTQGTLTPAAPGSTGGSNDWENEIHPNPGGYARLAAVMGPAIDAVMAR